MTEPEDHLKWARVGDAVAIGFCMLVLAMSLLIAVGFCAEAATHQAP